MKRIHFTFMRCAAWLTAFSLVLSAVPAAPAKAEDPGYVEDGGMTADDPAADYSVFVITGFPEFEKDEEGNFLDPSMQEKYGNLTVAPGTMFDDLGLPDELSVVGYVEAQGPEALTGPFDLTDMVWKLKSDTDETYSESSPEGEYTFIPDLEKYMEEQLAQGTALYDELKLTEELKLPRIKITVAAPQTEPQPAEPETQPTEPEQLPDPNQQDPNQIPSAPEVDPNQIPPASEGDPNQIPPASEGDPNQIPPASEGDPNQIPPASETYEQTPQSEDGSIPIPPASEGTPEQTPQEPSYTGDTGENSDGDIFSNLNDDLIDASDSDYYDSNSDGSTAPPAEQQSDGNTAPPAEQQTDGDNSSPTEQQPDGGNSLPTEQQPDGGNSLPTEQQPDGGNSLPTEQQPDGITAPPTAPIALVDIEQVMLTLSDGAGSYEHPVVFRLSASQPQENRVQVSLPCGSNLNLSALTVQLTDQNTNAPVTLDVVQDAAGTDFSDGTEKEFSVSGTSQGASAPDGSFTLLLAVTKNAHTPGAEPDCTNPQICTVCQTQLQPALGHTPGPAATCTAPQTCTRCGAVLADVTDHTPGPAATCTTPQTCTICGAILVGALGHAAGPEPTCTAPQTCTRCGAVLANALGHDWVDATCTTPQTCKRCGATSGTALGHLLYDNWEVITASTDSKHGEEVRYCARDNCDYSESRALNIIASAASNGITGITGGASYNLNTVISFNAVGGGMGNTSPINGDERYVPDSWQIQNVPGTFRDNYTGSFSITQPGTYTLNVSYKKQVYNNGWQGTNVVDSKSVTFTAGDVVEATPTEGIRINPQTGDDTPVLPLVIALGAAAIVLILVLVYRKKRK